MLDDRTPMGIAATGVVLVIVGYAVQELVPRLVKTGGFVAGAGWVALAIALILFIISLVKGGTPRV